MKNNLRWILACLVLLMLVILALPYQVFAGKPQQVVYQTPTALPDGRIFYTIKPGDTCLSISLLTGVTLDQLRKLNNLDLNCTIPGPGQKLLIAVTSPATATPTAGPSPTPSGTIFPTATPFHGNGEVCIAVFNDLNGNAVREDNEVLIANAAVSLTATQGNISKTGTTANATDALCFEDLPEGQYNISVAIPEGYNPTTVMNYTLQLAAGDLANLDFGAQLSAKAQPLPPAEGGRSPLLGLVGAVLLLVGIGMGIYIIRSRK
jgi:LysM repeat protein